MTDREPAPILNYLDGRDILIHGAVDDATVQQSAIQEGMLFIRPGYTDETSEQSSPFPLTEDPENVEYDVRD